MADDLSEPPSNNFQDGKPVEDACALFRSPVQEHHIDFILEEEFACNPDFLRFFVKEANKSIASSAEGRRDLPEPTDRAHCTAVRSLITEAGESDVLVIYESSESGRRTAILIEDKIRAGFQSDQAERYRQRGSEWVGKYWHEFWTCLVAPTKYAKSLAGFDSRVPLETLRLYFASGQETRAQFKAKVLDDACRAFESSGVRIIDETMTQFRSFYAEQAEQFFSHGQLDVQWDRPRNAWHGDNWFAFRSPILPRGTGILHKAVLGVVHLSFANTDIRVLGSALERCATGSEYKPVPTGKSASIPVLVTKIVDFAKRDENAAAIREALSAVENLLSFWSRDGGRILEEIRSVHR